MAADSATLGWLTSALYLSRAEGDVVYLVTGCCPPGRTWLANGAPA